MKIQHFVLILRKAEGSSYYTFDSIINLTIVYFVSQGGQGALQHPLPHAHAPPVPMPPHPASLPPGMSGPGSGLLQLSNAMMNSSGPHGMSSVKDEKERGKGKEEI